MSKVPLPLGIDSEEMMHEVDDEPEGNDSEDEACRHCGALLGHSASCPYSGTAAR